MKGLWDSDRRANRQLHVVLVCSASIRIQSSLTESMAGRFEPLYVPHWSFSEMRSAFGFDLNEYLYFGGYSGAAKFIHDQASWRHYVIDAQESAIRIGYEFGSERFKKISVSPHHKGRIFLVNLRYRYGNSPMCSQRSETKLLQICINKEIDQCAI